MTHVFQRAAVNSNLATPPSVSLCSTDGTAVVTPVGLAPHADPNQPLGLFGHPASRYHQSTPTNPFKHGSGPVTPSKDLQKRPRTSHPSDETTYMSHTSHIAATSHGTRKNPMVVSRDSASRNFPSSGRVSMELANQVYNMRLNSASCEADREGRLSVGGMSTVLPLHSHHPQNAASPQCLRPNASPFHVFDPFRQSLSIAHDDHPNLEYSQTETDVTFIARRIITEFREVAALGSGTFGQVVLYEEVNSGDYVAVKISRTLYSKEEVLRARRERDILNALRGFPHIVHLYTSWEEGKDPQMHLQMQYCQNGNVGAMAKYKQQQGTPWTEEEILSFMGQMALALDATHSVNVAHVDFKPENVLIDECHCYVLTDFGCSLTLDEAGRPRDHILAGHPAGSFEHSHDEGDKRYLSHDMMNEKRHYKAGDMFSFGMSLYELMSNAPLPLKGEQYEYLRNRTELKELEALGYSTELVTLVTKLLSRNPLHRPTAREVLQYPGLQINQLSLSINTSSTAEVAASLSCGRISDKTFQFQQTCFEVANYLMKAAYRDVHNVYPPTVWRLRRGSNLPPTGAESPLRGAVRASLGGVPTGEVLFRTPTLKKPE